jgi:endo-alpha-1,4-polygalactosaminidase (GH114 family)
MPAPGRGVIVKGNPKHFDLVDSLLKTILESTPRATAALYRPRHSVALVVSAKEMMFESHPVTWNTLRERLEKVPDRPFTVFCVGYADDDPDTRQAFEAARTRAGELREEYGFEYLSLVGTQPLGAEGAPTHYILADDKAMQIARPDQLTSTPPGRPRHAVKLVIGADEMTLEGDEVTWNELPGFLKKVPHRAQTVFEIAMAADGPPEEKAYEEAKSRAGALCRSYGFEHLSFTGQAPLGAKGTPTHYTAEPAVTAATP